MFHVFHIYTLEILFPKMLVINMCQQLHCCSQLTHELLTFIGFILLEGKVQGVIINSKTFGILEICEYLL